LIDRTPTAHVHERAAQLKTEEYAHADQ